jgi:hypothetical protein
MILQAIWSQGEFLIWKEGEEMISVFRFQVEQSEITDI